MITFSLERAALSALLLLAFIAGLKAAAAFQRGRLRSRSRGTPLPAALMRGAPTLLYFWSDTCAQCAPQERQIEAAARAIRASGNDLQVRKINALRDPTLVKSMHVMTVPTTVLLDPHGNVAAWNPGLTQAGTLVEQYHQAA